MTQVVSTISAILNKFGNEILENQINVAVPFMGSGALTIVDTDGGTWVTNIQTSVDSVRNIADGGTLPTGSSSDPTQASQLPAAVFGRLSIGRVAAYSATGGKGQVDLVANQVEVCGDEIGRQIGRQIFDSSFAQSDGYTTSATWAGTPSSVTIKFPDITGFGEGAAVNYVDVSASKSYTVKVTLVKPLADGSLSANVAGEVTFENSVAGVAGTTNHANSDLNGIVVGTDDLWTQAGNYTGSGGASTATLGTHICVSLTDICSPTSTIHGLAATSNGWSGNTASSFGALTALAVASFKQRIFQRSGSDPTHIIMSPVTGATFGDAQLTTASVRSVDGVLDKYGNNINEGKGMALMGVPVILDQNCPNTKVFFHSKKHVDFRRWKKASPEGYGGKYQLVGNSNFDYDVQISAMHNLTCRKRKAFGLITGVTGV